MHCCTICLIYPHGRLECSTLKQETKRQRPVCCLLPHSILIREKLTGKHIPESLPLRCIARAAIALDAETAIQAASLCMLSQGGGYKRVPHKLPRGPHGNSVSPVREAEGTRHDRRGSYAYQCLPKNFTLQKSMSMPEMLSRGHTAVIEESSGEAGAFHTYSGTWYLLLLSCEAQYQQGKGYTQVPVLSSGWNLAAPTELVMCSEEHACFSQHKRSSLSKAMIHHEIIMKQIFTMKIQLNISTCV